VIGNPRIPRLGRPTVAILAVLAATLAIGSSPALGATPGPAACQEYSVCGGPTGGSGAGGTPGAPASRTPRPSVGARTTLPFTGYPLTPAVAIGAAVVAVGLLARGAVGVARRGRDASATSVPGR
jgi:hypothetical protein